MSDDFEPKWDAIKVAKFWIILIIILVILTLFGVYNR